MPTEASRMLRIVPLSVALRLRLLAARFTGRELKTQQKNFWQKLRLLVFSLRTATRSKGHALSVNLSKSLQWSDDKRLKQQFPTDEKLNTSNLVKWGEKKKRKKKPKPLSHYTYNLH